jgi:2-C-methyl-D-erythritol 4-phosphate cytidylyltransferase
MYGNKHVGVIIAAAGSSTRMGGAVKKQFLELAGKPIWMHAVEKFDSCPQSNSIVLAAPADSLSSLRQQASAFQKVRMVVAGGAHRQDSVRNALESMKTFSPDVILVHDAVRPFISSNLIQEIIKAAEQHGAAIPAVLPKETVKVSDGNSFVKATEDRDALWLAQTPQGFQSALLYRAFDRAAHDGFYGTDEASLVERIGVKVKIITGSYENIKITTPEDLRYAEFVFHHNRQLAS